MKYKIFEYDPNLIAYERDIELRMQNYYRKKREFDSDILILFDSDEQSVSLLSLVESFVDKGFSVRVEHSVPEGYKAKTVYAFENGALREVSVC